MSTRLQHRLFWRNHCSRSHSWPSNSFCRGRSLPCCLGRSFHRTKCFSWIVPVYNLQQGKTSESNSADGKQQQHDRLHSSGKVLPWLETKLRTCVSVNRRPRHRLSSGCILSRSQCNQWGQRPLHSAWSAATGAVSEMCSLLMKSKEREKKKKSNWSMIYASLSERQDGGGGWPHTGRLTQWIHNKASNLLILQNQQQHIDVDWRVWGGINRWAGREKVQSV